ncbi:hypothetical protein EDD22DRAFT_1008937 [Suillus occidentalis]|nr:hypothetical protein EDD22DRAFT_1008937 [Suillus occidentalis]
MAHTVNVNPADDEELDDDPGAYIIKFGKVYIGERLDSIPTSYRLWATGADCQHFRWHADFKEANDRYEEQLLLQTPGAYTLSFGKHKNERLDEVPEDYIWSVIHPEFSDNIWYESLVKAHRRYLDKVYQNKSPGSVIIWFGQRYQGYTLSVAYQRRGFVEFCLAPEHSNFKWYHRFKDLVRRYEAYLTTHRRPHRGRKPANVKNPVGELLGSWDDRGSVSSDDDYVRDDFLVDDGEGEDEDEDSQEESSGSESDNNNDDRGFDDDFQHEEVYEHHEVNTAGDLNVSSPPVERPSRASADVSQTSESDSDDDTPLEKLCNKLRAKRVSGKERQRSGSHPAPKLAINVRARAVMMNSLLSPRENVTKVLIILWAVHAFAQVPTMSPSPQLLILMNKILSRPKNPAASSSTADDSESSQSSDEELSADDYIPPSLLGSYYRPCPRVTSGSYQEIF